MMRYWQRVRFWVGLGLCLGIGVGASIFVQTRWLTSGDFRHGLWSPSYLLTHGMNPYGMGAPMQVVPSVWMPMIIGLWFPLGWLDSYEAANLWLLVNVVCAVVIVWLCWRVARASLAVFTILLIAIFLFPPLLSHLMMGQLGVMVTLLYLLSAYLVKRGLFLPSGVLVAVALTKPQLSVLALPGLLIGLYYFGKRKAVLGFVVVCLAAILWLTIPLWLANSAWLNDMLAIAQQTPTWLQPTLFRMLQIQMGEWGLALWLMWAIVLFGINLAAWMKLDPPVAMCASLALTVLMSPYLWSWDFVLLIPAIVYVFSAVRRHAARALIALGYAVAWGLMVTIRWTTDNSDERYWWLPICLLAILVAGYAVQFFQTHTRGVEAKRW